MVSVEEARQIIAANTAALPPEVRHIGEALEYVLAEDVFSATDIPGFDQSAMDGYAIRYEDAALPLSLAGEMYAGIPHQLSLHAGEAVRVFTGAPVPLNADTVVMQEKVMQENGHIRILDDKLKKGLNIRRQGEDIKAGSVAAKAGSTLSPAAIGLLAGAGIATVKAHAKPGVGIIVTGNELQQPGSPLTFGQVYDANAYQLKAALQQAGISLINVYHADDSIADLTHVLQRSLNHNDVTVLTGGVSVGDYDYVVQTLATLGVAQLFHKIKQKPGKPMFFGTKDDKLIFGLPGNPASALTCFYMYVRPAITFLYGKKKIFPEAQQVKINNAFAKPAGMTYFLKGLYEQGKVSILDAQESYRLSSFARANCLIELDAPQTSIAVNDKVKIHFIK